MECSGKKRWGSIQKDILQFNSKDGTKTTKPLGRIIGAQADIPPPEVKSEASEICSVIDRIKPQFG
jgi:hypothetical protein